MKSSEINRVKSSQIDHDALGQIFKNETGHGQVSSVLEILVTPQTTRALNQISANNPQEQSIHKELELLKNNSSILNNLNNKNVGGRNQFFQTGEIISHTVSNKKSFKKDILAFNNVLECVPDENSKSEMQSVN